MSLQRICFAAVLGSVTAAAILCLFLALTMAPGRLAVQALGFAFATAISGTVMLLLARLGSLENWRPLSIAAILIVVVETLIMFVVITLTAIVRTSTTVEALFAISGSAALTGGPVLIAMRAWVVPAHRRAATVATVFCIIAFGITLMLLYAQGTSLADQIWKASTLIETVGCSLALSLAGAGAVRDRWSFLRLCAIIVASLALISGLYQICKNFWTPYWGLTIVLAASFFLAHLNLMRLSQLSRNERWLRWPAGVGALTTAVLFNISVFRPYSSFPSYPAGPFDVLLAHALAVSSVVTGALTLLIFILWTRGLVQKPIRQQASLYQTLCITCPGCDVRQTLPTPEAACGNCGMQFLLRANEPFCPECNYLLLMFKGDECPECGLPISRPPGPVSDAGGERTNVTPLAAFSALPASDTSVVTV